MQLGNAETNFMEWVKNFGFASATISAYAALVAVAVYEAAKAVKARREKSFAERRYGDPETIKKITRIDTRVHDLLTELRIVTRACRATAFNFHNGEQFFDNSPIQRMSPAYESVEGGFAPTTECEASGGFIVSLMAPIIEKMFDDTPLICKVDSLPETFSRTRLRGLNVLHFAVLPLKQNNHKIIGCIKLHWMRDAPVEADWVEDKMRICVSTIENLLSERLVVTGKHAPPFRLE